MFLTAKYPRAPQCFACIRQIFGTEAQLPRSPFRTQVRGKKKVRLPTTINVKLIKDIRGYGRKGSIVPVAPGRMRNIWHPSKRAEYMTAAQLKTMPDLVVERDFAFGLEQSPEGQAKEDESSPVVEVKLLSPQRTTQLISAYVPEILEFYRQPIATPEPEKPKSSRRPSRTAASSAAEDLVAASEPAPVSMSKSEAIYGSVSTADIVDSIQVILSLEGVAAGDTEAARVVLSAEDVKIVQEERTAIGEEVDRIKRTGDFPIDITVKGGEAVRRTVRVLAEK